jgi:hypothetical protein
MSMPTTSVACRDVRNINGAANEKARERISRAGERCGQCRSRSIPRQGEQECSEEPNGRPNVTDPGCDWSVIPVAVRPSGQGECGVDKGCSRGAGQHCHMSTEYIAETLT